MAKNKMDICDETYVAGKEILCKVATVSSLKVLMSLTSLVSRHAIE